jgi:hypothetical protein
MLATQVAYQQVVESRRHNMEVESQGRRDLDIKQGNLDEAKRHNTVFETETHRHNIAGEELGWFNAQENRRHNLVGEDIAWFNANENQRHNLVAEDQGQQTINETVRHNKVNENIGFANINLGYANLSEQARHNKVSESIGQYQARTGRIQAYASTTQARAAMANANTNYLNYTVNKAEVSSRMKVNEATVDKYNSDISFNRERERTEQTQQSLNQSSMWRNYSQIGKNIFDTISGFSASPEIDETTMWSN